MGDVVEPCLCREYPPVGLCYVVPLLVRSKRDRMPTTVADVIASYCDTSQARMGITKKHIEKCTEMRNANISASHLCITSM
jgi:hypothetical protein